MKPPSEIHSGDTDPLRRELILAQVQLMELEDARDDLQTQLAAAHALLTETQCLADEALRERDRAAGENAALLAEREKLTAAEAVLRNELAAARAEIAARGARLDELAQNLATQEQANTVVSATARTASERVAQLEAERQTMKGSRSWRWTAPLRALERALRGRGGASA
jgi:chromosome segregation ATPase